MATVETRALRVDPVAVTRCVKLLPTLLLVAVPQARKETRIALVFPACATITKTAVIHKYATVWIDSVNLHALKTVAHRVQSVLPGSIAQYARAHLVPTGTHTPVAAPPCNSQRSAPVTLTALGHSAVLTPDAWIYARSTRARRVLFVKRLIYCRFAQLLACAQKRAARHRILDVDHHQKLNALQIRIALPPKHVVEENVLTHAKRHRADIMHSVNPQITCLGVAVLRDT